MLKGKDNKEVKKKNRQLKDQTNGTEKMKEREQSW